MNLNPIKKERNIVILIVVIVLILCFLFFSFFPGIVQVLQNSFKSVTDNGQYFTINLILSLFGIWFAAIGYFCAIKHAKNFKDTLFPRTKIPMAIMGIVMYNFIAITAVEAFLINNRYISVLHQFLILFTGFFTMYLIYKAFKVKLFCPGCIACWIVNSIMIVLLFNRWNFFNFQ